MVAVETARPDGGRSASAGVPSRRTVVGDRRAVDARSADRPPAPSQPAPSQRDRHRRSSRGSILVPVERLEELVRLVGEAASAHLRVGRMVHERLGVAPIAVQPS